MRSKMKFERDPKEKEIRKTIRVPASVYERVERFINDPLNCNRYTFTDVALNALNNFFIDETDIKIIQNAHHRFENKIENLESEIRLLQEMNILFLRYFFVLSPDIDEDKYLAINSGTERFDKYCQSLRKFMKRGRTKILDELLNESSP